MRARVSGHTPGRLIMSSKWVIQSLGVHCRGKSDRRAGVVYHAAPSTDASMATSSPPKPTAGNAVRSRSAGMSPGLVRPPRGRHAVAEQPQECGDDRHDAFERADGPNAVRLVGREKERRRQEDHQRNHEADDQQPAKLSRPSCRQSHSIAGSNGSSVV